MHLDSSDGCEQLCRNFAVSPSRGDEGGHTAFGSGHLTIAPRARSGAAQLLLCPCEPKCSPQPRKGGFCGLELFCGATASAGAAERLTRDEQRSRVLEREAGRFEPRGSFLGCCERQLRLTLGQQHERPTAKRGRCRPHVPRSVSLEPADECFSLSDPAKSNERLNAIRGRA